MCSAYYFVVNSFAVLGKSFFVTPASIVAFFFSFFVWGVLKGNRVKNCMVSVLLLVILVLVCACNTDVLSPGVLATLRGGNH